MYVRICKYSSIAREISNVFKPLFLLIHFLQLKNLLSMKQAVVAVFTILVLMGAIVHRGESYIRAGRDMINNKQGQPIAFAEDYYNKPVEAAPRAPALKRG